MFPNLHTLSDTPVARTNMIQLDEKPLGTIRRLLTPVSNLYAIDFGVQNFHKERKEKRRDFYARIHREIKAHLRQTLKIDIHNDVKYELHRLPSGQFVYFYLAPATAQHLARFSTQSTRIEQLCQQLIANEHSLTRLIQGLFSLHIKMVLLEQASDRFPVAPVYFNAVIYLNARLSQPVAKKRGFGVMEAFELDVFASEQRELAFTLHKRKFLVEPAEDLHLELDQDKVWFNTASGRVKAQRKLDARDSKLEFFRERSGYGESQAYTYNVVMNAAVERLTELEIPHTPIPFQATHEVNQFVTDLDEQTANTLLVVNNGVEFNAMQEAFFFDALAAQLPGYKLWSAASLEQAQKNRFSDLPTNTSILVLNPVGDDASNSIRQLCNETSEYGNFFAAYDADQKKPGLLWDIYTQLKLDRLNGWLQQDPLPVVLQGLNIDRKLLDAIDYIGEQSKADPEQFSADLAKPRSRLKSAVNLMNSKIRRTKTELWFKESLLIQRHISLPNLPNAHYTAYAVRSTNNGTTLLAHVELTSDSNQLTIVNAGVTEGDLDWLAVEHPPLERLDKLFDNSFFLYDHATDVMLTSYNSVRVPRLVGPSHIDVVDLYRYQEQEKAIADRDGIDFNEYMITRSAKPELNVLPYLIAPGRSTHDPLTKSQKMKHHHIYLQPHDNGLYVLVSDAQPTNPSIARPNLVENLLIRDAQGELLEVLGHPLAGAYLNSFTLDVLKSGDSSKSSIFAKLARLMMEN